MKNPCLPAFAAAATAMSGLRLSRPEQETRPRSDMIEKQSMIAFVSTRDGNHQVYVMDGEGGNLRQLTTGPRGGSDFSWAPDAKRIVFTTATREGFALCTMNADGSDRQLLLGTPDIQGSPRWSPDGKTIAFCSDRAGGDSHIYVMNLDASNQKRLIESLPNDSSPSWSPDGKRIAFSTKVPGFIRVPELAHDEVYVVDADGKNLKRLTMGSRKSNNDSPSWSPDGMRIAFSSSRDGNYEIYVMDADGGNLTRLTSNSAVDGKPSWSPEGKWIAFESYRDGNYEIYVMDADGSNQRNLSRCPSDDISPSWAPLPKGR